MLVLADASYMQIRETLIPTAIPEVYVGLVSNHATSGRVMSEMSKPLQVYVVEDSQITQRLLASAIEEAGAEVSGSSADAQTAIGDVFALQPDMVLIDISLASGSGFDVLKALQDHGLAQGQSRWSSPITLISNTRISAFASVPIDSSTRLSRHHKPWR